MGSLTCWESRQAQLIQGTRTSHFLSFANQKDGLKKWGPQFCVYLVPLSHVWHACRPVHLDQEEFWWSVL